MPRIARGHRDAAGRWNADDPGEYPPMDVHGTLPWSVLRQDSPSWQARKGWWTRHGVDDLGPRAHAPAMMATGRHGAVSGGVSAFDPHLAEVCYRWYCPPGGTVVDPLAGGPVRGLVAGHLGHPYLGVDLLTAQVAANRHRAAEWHDRGLLAVAPVWRCGDAAAELPALAPGSADYALTCPPYHDRERYSDDPRDLSAMRWPAFLEAYTRILTGLVRVLAADRYMTVVVSDIRDRRGHLRGLPALTTTALTGAGVHLINEQVLVAPLGLAAKRMRIPWEAARTTTRIHQHVLTYTKGDRRAAARTVREGTPR
jgi:hypothetical protein